MIFRQIRFQLLALIVGIVLLAALFIGGFVLHRVHANLTEDAIMAQRHLSNALKQGLAMKFEEIRQHLQHVAEHPLLLNPDPGKSRELLSGFLEQNPLFFSALVYDRSGTVLTAIYRNHSPVAERIVGRNLLKAGKKYQQLIEDFQTVVKTNQPLISETVSSVRQGPLLVMNVPVRPFDRPDTLVRVLSLGIHLNGAVLQQTLSRFAPPNGFLALIDRQGTILARAGSDLPADLSGIVLDPMPEEHTPQSAWTTLDGRDMLVSARSFPDLQAVLMIGRSREAVLGRVSELSQQLLILGLVAVFLAMGTSLVLADRFITQILRLIEGIRKVGDGILSWRIGELTEDELGEAGRAFNTMADRLERNRLIEELWRQRGRPDA